MRLTSLFLGLGLACFVTACATSEKKSAQPRDLQALFKKADTSGNGTVSRKEFGDFMITEIFNTYDKNGDGFVSKSEFVGGGGEPANFSKINRADDGKITLAEAKSSKLIRDTMTTPFDEADVNGNGQVSWEEFQQWRQRAKPYIGVGSRPVKA